MDELELLAKEAEASEKIEAERYQPEPEQSEEPSEQLSEASLIAAKNRAESFLRVCEGGVRLLVDSRLKLSKEEVDEGRDSLGPVIDKYNLQGDGTGRMPMEEEITAGFYIGRMIKKAIRAVKRLRMEDRKREQELREHGKKREHTATQQPHNVSGAVGVRKESDVAPPFANS